MKKINKAQIQKLAEEAKDALNALEGARAAYRKMDEITEKVLALDVDLSSYGIVVVDNFAGKNKVWKPSAVARFELKKVG